MAPAFEPPVAVGVGVGVCVGVEDVSVDPVGFEEVPVGPVFVPVGGEPEGPIRAPGPISGLAENAVVKRRKEKTEEDSHHRWPSICWRPRNSRARLYC
jgi:hypothetical protein